MDGTSVTRALSRRRMLWVAGGGASALALGVAGCSDQDGADEDPAASASPATDVGTPAPSTTPVSTRWPEPEEIRSRDGVLDITLRMAPAMVPFEGGRRWALTVNGTTPGPTLRVRPGDVMKIRLVNELGHATNLHTHGLHVSPAGNSDNPFIEIPAGQTFDYEIPIPETQRPGLNWYHPHLHHRVAEQLYSGCYGAIIVEGADDGALGERVERLLMLNDTTIGQTEDAVMTTTAMVQREGREGDALLVNGVRVPGIEARTGTLEHWRIVNASSSRFYRLALEGHEFAQVGSDAGRLGAPVMRDEIVMVPGERVEVLVRPSKTGTFALETLPISRGTMGMGMGGGGGTGTTATTRLATFEVTGGAGGEAKLPARTGVLESLKDRTPVKTRNLTFEMAGMSFVIDGKSFNAERVDQAVNFGTTEDWVITNTSPMDHPFHLHVWAFQVMEQSAGEPPAGWKDVVDVPAGGWVRIRIPFTGLAGRTVYHCHILDHEDLGMMAVVDVT
ncbi:MAG TPA: multicopper oxidase family protein [Tepidiformaceae bacterium]|nr:multicopper oxidase family protein [Tepidiformaceae bacterium]